MSINAICKRVAGLDVHKKVVVVTILLEQADGQIHQETRSFGTLPNDTLALAEWLTSLQIELAVMESTGVYWKTLYAAFEKVHLKTHVVNARHIKKVPGRKTDVTDSQWLAQLGRFGLVSGSFVPDEPLRQLRCLTRYRIKLQRMIVNEKNRLHKMLDLAGIRLSAIVSDIHGVSSQAIIQGLINEEPIEKILTYLKGTLKKKASQLEQVLQQPLPPTQRYLLKEISEHIKFMEKERQRLDTQITLAMQPYADYWKILQTLPGMDEWAAAAIIAECGVDMQRFGDSAQFCSWSAMCPGNNESAGKHKSGKTRKGNHFLRTTLCEVSNATIKTKSQFKDKYKTLVIRRGHKRAVVAIGHKLLRVIYHLLSHKTHYQDPGIDYQQVLTARNASRWLNALHKYGFVIH